LKRPSFVLAAAFAAFASTPASAVDPTGIPQCDDLLNRYESCASQLPADRVHKAQIELLEGSVSIRAAAGDPKLRGELESYCGARFDQMKREGDIKECMAK